MKIILLVSFFILYNNKYSFTQTIPIFKNYPSENDVILIDSFYRDTLKIFQLSIQKCPSNSPLQTGEPFNPKNCAQYVNLTSNSAPRSVDFKYSIWRRKINKYYLRNHDTLVIKDYRMDNNSLISKFIWKETVFKKRRKEIVEGNIINGYYKLYKIDLDYFNNNWGIRKYYHFYSENKYIYVLITR